MDQEFLIISQLLLGWRGGWLKAAMYWCKMSVRAASTSSGQKLFPELKLPQGSISSETVKSFSFPLLININVWKITLIFQRGCASRITCSTRNLRILLPYLEAIKTVLEFWPKSKYSLFLSASWKCTFLFNSVLFKSNFVPTFSFYKCLFHYSNLNKVGKSPV